MSLLSLDAVSVEIRGSRVVKGVSLTVASGEIVALTGGSGSGKSMTALAAMGLLPEGARATGSLQLEGQELLGLPEAQMCALRGRQIGMVFQEPMTALDPLQTIGAQVAETLRIHRAAGRRAVKAAAGEMLMRVGLPPDKVPPGRYPHMLSGGQRQRVGIAMAVALRPRLLIADEPTTALDVTTQAQVLQLLQGLVREFGMGLLLITHDLAVVGALADKVVVMEAGAVVEAGPARHLLAAPAAPYTQRLVAAARYAVLRRPQPAEPPEPTEGRPDKPSAETPPLLRVEHVVRAYPLPRRSVLGPRRWLRAVDGVSLTLGQGEKLGLVGESGCGKSTLARAILGLEPVQEGAIWLGNSQVTPASDRCLRRRIQAVFQDPYGSFDPRQRVARLVCEPFHLLDPPPRGAVRQAALDQALTDVGLSPQDAEKFIHAFSGGQRQRLAIARALLIRPDVILFDEAVSALDVTVRAQVLDLLATLSRQRPLAYIFVSHDLSVVRQVTDRVLVMQAGRIVEEGPTEEVFSNPRHPHTQALVAATLRLPEPDEHHAPR